MSFKVRDPVHNFISLRKKEVQLLDTSALQRLRGISQLAMAGLVYPGAIHTRFEHSLGVTHVANLMAKELGLNEDEGEVGLVRLAALVHDIGHGPFSHVSEHALERYADRTKLHGDQKKEKIHELITARIIETDDEIIKLLGKDTCQEIAKLLSEGHGQPALKSIVSGPLDADKQDYLLRDSFFCGVPYGIFDMHQLHRSLTLEGSDDEKELMIKHDVGGIHAVEQYVLAKYYLTTNVYRHKVRLITDQMIVRAIMLGIEKDKIEELNKLYRFDNSNAFVENYIRWDDAKFMHEFCINGNPSKCKDLLDRLRSRRLLKRVFEARVNEFRDEVSDMLLQLPKPTYGDLRSKIEEAISKKLHEMTRQEVDPDFVIVHTFNIRSVREMSRNDEAEILIAGTTPKLFEDESTLFASIRTEYADEFVEVYAPVKWETAADKKKFRRGVKESIKELIETKCLESLKGAPE